MKLGQTIIVRTLTAFNGSNVHPAIVNHVWSEGMQGPGTAMVNCTVLPDCGTPYCETSLTVYPTREEAEAAVDKRCGFLAE